MGCMGMQKDASLGAGPVAPADPLFAEALSADAVAVAWLTGPLPPTPQSFDVEDPVEQLSQPFHNFDQHWNRAALSPDRVKGSPMTLATCGLVSTKDVVRGET